MPTASLLAFFPSAHSDREFILKNHPSLSFLLPPPLLQRLAAAPSWTWMRTPLAAAVCPIRCRSLAPVTRASRPLPSHALVLVVLAPPVVCAANLADPSPMLVAVVLMRAAGAGC
jgi:hypothetical protein